MANKVQYVNQRNRNRGRNTLIEVSGTASQG